MLPSSLAQDHDALHAANELSLNRAADTQILSMALADGRIVVTADLDFPRLLAMLGALGPGLILLRGGNYSELESLECVRRVLAVIPHDQLPRSIVVVDRQKIRRRWLPI